MEKIILGGRYALLEKISEGGMSSIYRAYCNVLNRTVAVKILKQEFSDDEDFLTKFNNEAKSAASLNHPNIIGIYDVGSDDDVSYIVMEFVDGKNIKQLIRERGRFAEKGALDVIRQICVALKVAHDQGIVHRDIKPHNIMINKFGIVKVGDFGIAKVASTSTITPHSESIIGSAHYMSPEQARSEHVDKRSDIYSLGIVFYEMLIGKVPFDEDKAFDTVMKHVNSQIEIPDNFKNIISPSVQNILLKMTQKNPNNRYMDVSQIIADIDKIQNENEEISYELEKDYNTKVMPSVRGEDFQEGGKNRKKKKRGIKKYFVLLTLIVVGLSSAYLISAGNIWDVIAGNNVKIPDIIGKSLEAATKELEDAELKIKVTLEKEDEEVEKGTILSQNPDPGIKLRKGEEVSVTVSKEPDNMTTIPDLVGKTLEEARQLAEEKKVKLNIQYKFSEDVEEKYVMSQKPEKDEKAKFDDVVTIEVSKGIEIKKEKIPNLVGATLDDARMITGNFSIGSINYNEDTSKPDGRVLSQEPEAGSLQVAGTQINIVINKIEPKREPEKEKPPVTAEIATKSLELVLPKSENVLLTLVDKTSGAIAYSNTINIQEGENVSIQLTGHKGESKEYDIYLGGKHYATTGTVTF